MSETQAQWIDRAEHILPAGGFGNFDPGIIIQKGLGAHVWDMDSNQYIDYLIGSGPMILGHGHPEVVEAVQEQITKGMTFFANNEKGVELAEEIGTAVACAAQVRFVSTGGEADMYAMRLARAFTGRDKIIKFEGGYHGMSAEAQMSLMPTKLANFPQAVPDSAGIPESVQKEMLIAPYNDIEFVKGLINEYAGEIAAIIVEPLQRIVPPAPGFLQALRDQCTKNNIILIFDEVVTGFRLAYGGAQELYGVTPDLCTMGKIIGGGFPLAAVAGPKDIMAHFDKSKVGEEKWLMQIGTLSGNPVAAVAGLKTLEILRRDGQYEALREIGTQVQASLATHLSAQDIPHRILGDTTLFDVVFTEQDVKEYRGTIKGDNARHALFNKLLRAKNIFKSPTKFYPSLALTQSDLDQTDSAIQYAAKNL